MRSPDVIEFKNEVIFICILLFSDTQQEDLYSSMRKYKSDLKLKAKSTIFQTEYKSDMKAKSWQYFRLDTNLSDLKAKSWSYFRLDTNLT